MLVKGHSIVIASGKLMSTFSVTCIGRTVNVYLIIVFHKLECFFFYFLLPFGFQEAMKLALQYNDRVIQARCLCVFADIHRNRGDNKVCMTQRHTDRQIYRRTDK